MLITLFVVTLVAFGFMRLIPGGVVESLLAMSEGSLTQEDIRSIIERYGFDKPVHVQYLSWLGNLFRGDFGVSFLGRESVSEIVIKKVPVTFQLAALSMVIALAVGIPSGILSALWRDTAVDYVFRVVTAIGLAIPNFLLAILIMLALEFFFSYGIELSFVNLWEQPVKSLSILIWPAIALGTAAAATIGRMLRSTMLEVLGEDYIRTARAKGLPEFVVTSRHALKNALIPVVTVSGMTFALLLGGSIVTETVFALPGLGRAVAQAVAQREYALVQATILLAGAWVVVLNFLVDVSYAYLDPKIRLR